MGDGGAEMKCKTHKGICEKMSPLRITKPDY